MTPRNSDINQSVMKLMFCFHLSISIQLQLQCLPVKALQILLARKPAPVWLLRMIVIGQTYKNGVSATTSTHLKDQKDGFFTAFKSITLISGLFSGHDKNPIFFGFFRLVIFGMLWFLESPVGRKSLCVNKLLHHDPIAMSWTNSGCIDSSTPWSSSVWPGSLLVSWPSFISDLSISGVSSSNTSLPAVLISSSSLPWLLLFFALALLFSLLCFGSSNHQKPPTWKKLPRLGKIRVLLRRFGLCFRPFSRDLKFGEVGEPFQQICSPICSKLSARIINMLQTMLMAFQSGILNDFIFEPYLYPFQCWVRWNVTSSSWRSTSSNKSVSTCRFQTSWPNSLSNMENLGHSNPYADMIW